MDTRAAFLCVAFALLAFGGCIGGDDETGSLQLVEGEQILLEGHVTSVDATPMVVDGDGLLNIRTEDLGDISVRIPARERTCPARGLDTFFAIELGDTIRARGRVTGPRAVTVCAEETHFLERGQ